MANYPTISDDETRAPRIALLDDDAGLPARPIVRPPSRAKSIARQKLAETLAERFTHDAASAASIARAVVNPSQTRLALSSPIDERVPGGTLHMVHVDVWPVAVTPSPINPRAAGERTFPSGTPTDPRRRVFRRPLVAAGSDASGVPVLTLPVEDPEHLVESLRVAMEVLWSTADKLRDDLPRQGVMRPITLTAMRITHEDGTPDLTIATSPDGSTRTSIAWHYWGLDGAGEVYQPDDRKLGQRISAVEALAEKDVMLLSEDEQALLRLATIPAQVVVGYSPDPGSTVTFAQAVDSWVAAIHVDPPRPWGTSADLDTKATAILAAFIEQAGWSPAYLDYLAGMLSPDQAKQAGFRPHADARAVEILAVLGDDENMRILNDGLRRLIGGGKRPRRPDRLEPLVELMLSPMRGNATPTEIGVMRTILANLRDMAEWNRKGWHPTQLALEDLYAAAVAELESASAAEHDDGEVAVGPFVLELAYMAVFWLARHGGLRRQTHRGIGDDREPQHLLRQMMTSTYGLEVFRRVIEDGRGGREPLAVRPDGSNAKDPTGAPIAVSTEWLKEAFPQQQPADPGPDRPTLKRALALVSGAIDTLATAVARMTEVEGTSGESVAYTLGIAPHLVEEEMLPKLNKAIRELDYCARVWQRRHDANARRDEDEEVEA